MIEILDFLDKHMGFVTLIAGIFTLVIYITQKIDNKRNAAKIIIQEIRRAEDLIFDYKEHGQYKFTKKIIATNSWAKNIHHFVSNLDADELDRISNLYSTGEYLDSIITKVSDFSFQESIDNFKKSMVPKTETISTPVTPVNPQEKQAIFVQIAVEAPWKSLLEEITLKYEPIYHSEIIGKLKKISSKKWFKLF